MTNIRIFQHAGFESPCMINDWAKIKGFIPGLTSFHDGDSLEGVDVPDLLIIMGGPMGVHDETEFPWLYAEKEFIKKCVSTNTRILGICLGSQLLASCLGSRVYRNNRQEIGFFPVSYTPEADKDPVFKDLPNPWEVFHWHGDTFELPAGATHIAYSDITRNQAFRLGRFTGIQFHPEADERLICQMETGNDDHGSVPGNLKAWIEDRRPYLYGIMDNILTL
jgi:GMP synthase (glutamine-hydrolysing)